MLEEFQRRLRSGEFIKLKGDPTHRQYNEVIIEATAFLEALYSTASSDVADGGQ